MSHRIFIGIKVSAKFQDTYLRWVGSLEYKLPVRWMEIEGLHLTLIPPWYVEDFAETISRLHQLTNHWQKFQLHFTEISYGPTTFDPRIVWAKPFPEKLLVTLKDKIETVLSHPVKEKSFTPHVTLGRFSFPNGVPFPGIELQEKINWIEEIENITLFESIRKAEKPFYSIIATFPCAEI